MKSRRILALAASAMALALTGSVVRAQVVVFDPKSYAQDVVTAARQLQQINNQIVSLQNQAQMLINEAHNLATLPTSTLGLLQSDLARTQQLLGEAQHITYSTGQINQAFTTQYGQASLTMPQVQLVARAQQRWQTSLGAFQDALNVQAGVVTNLTNAKSQLSTLVTSSQGSVGALQATQSGNQLLALIAKELADLTAVVTAQSRADSLAAADKATAPADAQVRFSQFMAGGTYTPAPVSMYH
ncbi:MAG TPA: P-type conjugative transfer protein TrbJ [Caulobacteraceae bacterium]|jgi:P-type conjugative transfer protein TrbJ